MLTTSGKEISIRFHLDQTIHILVSNDIVPSYPHFITKMLNDLNTIVSIANSIPIFRYLVLKTILKIHFLKIKKRSRKLNNPK